MTTPAPEPAFISRQTVAARRFYLDLNPGRPRRAVVVCGGWEQCASDYRIDRVGFPLLSIEFVAAGRGWLWLDGREHALEAGSVFAYGPGVAHRIRSDPVAPLDKYFVDFTGREARRWMAACDLPPGRCARIRESVAVRDVFEQLVRRGGQQGAWTDRGCVILLELLLVTIAGANRRGAAFEGGAPATFERCLRYCNQHYKQLPRVASLATACHIEATYLSRLFRRYAGQTPYQYLQRLQMSWAIGQLQAGHRMAREVAEELGMDAFQFSRVFKRVHGVPPSEFRRLARFRSGTSGAASPRDTSRERGRRGSIRISVGDIRK